MHFNIQNSFSSLHISLSPMPSLTHRLAVKKLLFAAFCATQFWWLLGKKETLFISTRPEPLASGAKRGNRIISRCRSLCFLHWISPKHSSLMLNLACKHKECLARGYENNINSYPTSLNQLCNGAPKWNEGDRIACWTDWDSVRTH